MSFSSKYVGTTELRNSIIVISLSSRNLVTVDSRLNKVTTISLERYPRNFVTEMSSACWSRNLVTEMSSACWSRNLVTEMSSAYWSKNLVTEISSAC